MNLKEITADGELEVKLVAKLLTKAGFEVMTVKNTAPNGHTLHGLSFDAGHDTSVRIFFRGALEEKWHLTWRPRMRGGMKEKRFSNYKELVDFIKAGVWTHPTSVNEDVGMLKSMILKLVRAKQPIYINAKGRTFLSGNERNGYQALRSNKMGWLIQCEVYDDKSPDDRIARVQRQLEKDSLTTTSYKEYAMEGTGTHHSSLFEMERPIDEHYTLKKIEGVWTIIDREPVAESKKDDHEHAEFMLRQAAKKMVAAGLDSKVMPHAGGVRGPYIETKYAGFTINTFYKPEEDGSKWFGAWYFNGRRAGTISNFKTVEEIIKDIL